MTLSYDKILRRAALCMLMLLMTGACSRRGPVLTFREADDPTADTLADWSGVASGLHAAWGTTDKRYARSVVPCAAESECRLTAWRGERVSAQLVLWSVDSVGGVECRIGKFRSDGACLPAGIAQARFVRYVLTDTFGPGCGHRKDGDFPVSLAADMLDTLGRFDMDARTARPVWLTVSVPDDAPAGVYRSCVEVMGCGVKSLELPLELRVQERRLPRPAEWSYHLDLWQHPAAAARVMGLALWSDAHFDALRPLVRMLADAGQKVVTATLNKDPWNHQCFDAYEDMIRWTKRADGTWVYDYSLFDRWVGLCAGEGIDRQINCYSMLPWNNELTITMRRRTASSRSGPTPERPNSKRCGDRSSGISKRTSTRKDGSASAVSPWTSARPKPWMRRSACCAAQLPDWESPWPTTTPAISAMPIWTTSACRSTAAWPTRTSPGAAATDC